ncbi:MAG: peptidoglycan-binding protein, partial [Angustibacter sp.]
GSQDVDQQRPAVRADAGAGGRHDTADGAFGPRTAAAVKAAQRAGHVAQTGTVATLTWVTIEKRAYPLGRKRW